MSQSNGLLEGPGAAVVTVIPSDMMELEFSGVCVTWRCLDPGREHTNLSPSL